MANPFKGAMSFFGLASTEDEDRDIEEYSAEPSDSTFDDDEDVAPRPSYTTESAPPSSVTHTPTPRSRMNRITTIHPKTYGGQGYPRRRPCRSQSDRCP